MAFFEVRSIEKRFGGLVALNRISFRVEQGQIFGLIGPNGSGKTTIFNLINGYFPLDRGEIVFKGSKISGLKTHEICRRGIARTFQVVRPLKRMTVSENVMASAFLRTRTKAEAAALAGEVIDFCGMTREKGKVAKSLPIAWRKRLEIARALGTKPKLLLLDETAAGLNPSESDQAIELIKKIRDAGVTIIVVEHIMKVIMTICDRILAIDHGTVLAEGSPQQVASHPEVIAAYLGEDHRAER
jgi:branched-chain amino acid transport system ATP-binding protein